MARKRLTSIKCRAMVRPVHCFEPMERTHSTRYGGPSAISGLVIVPWAAGDGPDGETTNSVVMVDKTENELVLLSLPVSLCYALLGTS